MRTHSCAQSTTRIGATQVSRAAALTALAVCSDFLQLAGQLKAPSGMHLWHDQKPLSSCQGLLSMLDASRRSSTRHSGWSILDQWPPTCCCCRHWPAAGPPQAGTRQLQAWHRRSTDLHRPRAPAEGGCMARSDSQRPNRTCCRGRKVHSTPGSDARGICCAIPLSLRLYSSARSACRSRTVLPQQRCHCSPNACSAASAMSPAGCHERRQGQQHPARHHVMPGMTEGISTSHVHLPISCPGVQQACLQHKPQQA